MTNHALLKGLLLSFLIACFLTGAVSDSSAEIGDVSLEGFIGFGVGPEDDVTELDLGTAIGGGLGLGVEVSRNTQLRIDLSHYQWNAKETQTGVDPFAGSFTATLDQELTNISLFLGARFFSFLAPRVRSYFELGVSLNSLEEDDSIDISSSMLGSFSGSASESDTKIGIVPGLGFEVMVSERLGVGVNARYHIISEDIGEFEGIDPSFFSLTGMITYTPQIQDSFN